MDVFKLVVLLMTIGLGVVCAVYTVIAIVAITVRGIPEIREKVKTPWEKAERKAARKAAREEKKIRRRISRERAEGLR